MQTVAIHLFARGKCYIGDNTRDAIGAMREAFVLIKAGIGDYAIVDWPQHARAVLVMRDGDMGEASMLWADTREPLPQYPWV